MRARRPRGDEALDAEIGHHIDECVDLLLEQGWAPEAARAEAERRFGDRRRVRARLRALRREGALRGVLTDWLRGSRADVAYAVRGIVGNPGFSLPVVLTLALGIGATASIFAVADALLLRPLPYAEASRWVVLGQVYEDGVARPSLASERAAAWLRSTTDVFDGALTFTSTSLARSDAGAAEALSVLVITPGAERLLGLPLLMGRGFTAEDALPGAEPVAILSRAYWERTGADRDIVGRSIRLENGPVTVVGVFRREARVPTYGGERELWLPLRTDFTWMDRSLRGVQELWGRLAPGVSPMDGQARIDALSRSLAQADPSGTTWEARLTPLGEHRRANGYAARAMWMLMATGALILLIALLNGINLAVVRAGARSREIAVRLAIGGSTRAILRQLLVEGMLVGALGGLASAGLTALALRAMRGRLPTSVTFFSTHPFVLESRTLVVVLVISLAAGTALGLVPGALALRRTAPAGALGGRQADDTVSGRRMRNVLVAAQVAVSMTLLAAAGLLTNSMLRLLAVDPGFDYERVAMASLFLSATRYPDGASRAELLQRLEERLERVAGVEAVTIATGSAFAFDVELEAEGRPPLSTQPEVLPYVEVADDYLATMGTRLASGRGLTAQDAEADNVLVDRDMARVLWGDESALGRRFRLGPDREWLTVVGVVDELRLMGRDQRAGPYQFLYARAPARSGAYAEVTMRTSAAPSTLLPVFRRTLAALDPEQWTWKLRTGAEALAEEEDQPRFLVTLVGLLASIAVTLSAVGLYGVLAYSVGRRRRELGIRVALGADRGRLRTGVLAEGVAVAAVGVATGIVGALAASRVLQEFLYEVDGRDPVTLAVTGALLVGVALLAAYVPARRATEVDPVRALGAE